MSSLVAALKRFPPAADVNSRLKARMIERDAESVRRRYAQAPRQDHRQALCERIGLRAHNREWPRARGDLHIFTFFSLHNWEQVLPAALSPFGDVSVYEWRSRGFDDAAPDWTAHRDRMNADLLAAFHAANRRRPVDLVVGYASGFTVAPEVFLAMAQAGAITTNFCFDDKVRWPGPVVGGRHTSNAVLAAAVDLNLTSDPLGIARYEAHGGLAMFHAEAADPLWFEPLSVPFEFDVSFIGANFGWRPTLIRGLRRLGIAVECFGNGWPAGPVPNETMKVIYAKSRINLGCGGIGHSNKLLCLKGRDFEVPMSGSVYLTQANPELSLVFDVGSEILTYSSIEDCARTIREVLCDDSRAARIRAAARARCLRDHTYEARWTGVLRALGALT